MPRRPDAAWRDGHPHQTAGIMLGKFISQRMTQLNLFEENGPRANNKALMLLMDKQTERRLFFRAEHQQTWQMKRECCRRVNAK
ncbi:hypothetical protein R2203_001640 [Cronobacter dublinensis]|nr:hypothetical protein [Cronobacter dublinensis]